MLCGLAPALRVSRRDLQSGLRDGGRGSTGGLRDRLRGGLIVAEVALSLLLLVGAGLLIRSAIALQRTSTGFEPRGVLSARVTLPATSYTEPARIIETLRRIDDAAAAIPGVSSAAITSYAAMGGGGGSNGLVPEGREPVAANFINSTLRVITPELLPDDGRADRQGPELQRRRSRRRAARDDRQRAARRGRLPGQDPIGKRIGCCEAGPDGAEGRRRRRRRHPFARTGGRAAAGVLPADRAGARRRVELVPHDVRAWCGRPAIRRRSIKPLSAAVTRIDRDLPLFDVRTMEQRLAGSLATARFNTLLLTLLGAIGLVLAATGIYGVIALLRQPADAGDRRAHGARRDGRATSSAWCWARRCGRSRSVRRSAWSPRLRASRVLSSQLFGVSRTDPLTIAAVVATLIGVALVASAVPARRAAAVDPTRALQSE